jgi:hypothetical protein
MFLAALMSRSCELPHSQQVHSLIRKPATPFGPVLLWQDEQVTVEYASLTSSNHTPASAHLYLSMVRNIDQPASITDFACRVWARRFAFTLPTKTAPCLRTSLVLIGEALAGATLGNYRKYHVGDWRIVCDIQDKRIIVRVLRVVATAGNRREVYRQ